MSDYDDDEIRGTTEHLKRQLEELQQQLDAFLQPHRPDCSSKPDIHAALDAALLNLNTIAPTTGAGIG